MFSIMKVNASQNWVQVSYFLLEKNPDLPEVQRYVFYPLLNTTWLETLV